MEKILKNFWGWYDRHYRFHLGVSATLFALQLFHLYWLTTHVVAFKLLGQSFFDPQALVNFFIALADYLEIPALITTSLIYIRAHLKKFEIKNVLYLFLVNSQWLHIFWITDEVVINQLTGTTPLLLPIWLAWLAIVIDYLELPVIFDTSRRFYNSLVDKLYNSK